MRSYEDTLSPVKSIDGTLGVHRPTIDETFTTALGEADDILQLDLENTRQTELILKFSGEMSKWMTRKTDKLPARDAIYRSICFAAQVCDYILPSDYEINMIEYMAERTNDWRNMQALAEDSVSYLESRPNVADLIDDYLPDIDPSGDNETAAKLFASLCMMLAERSVGEQQVRATLDGITAEDFR